MKKAVKVFRVADSVHRATDERLELFYQVVSSPSVRGGDAGSEMQSKVIKPGAEGARIRKHSEKKVHAHG